MRRRRIKIEQDRRPITMDGLKVSLIRPSLSYCGVPITDNREFIGQLTGLKKTEKGREYWQVYWTKVPFGPKTKEFVACESLILIGHRVKGR